jgi:nucleotide-binding universal stress UspA family protein
MAPTETPSANATTPVGPVLLAYDGSELAGLAIEQAAGQLGTGRDALILCVWQPADVGFVTAPTRHFNADQAGEVKAAAEEIAAQGVTIANRVGFRAQSVVIEAAPTWKGIVAAARDHHASIIVLGSHRRTGLIGHLLGSVASAVAAYSPTAVLIFHQQA